MEERRNIMMNRIKRLAWLVALVLLMPLAHAPVHAESGWVTVAVPTQMSGFLFSNMWGSNSVDLDLRAMLHGYDTVYSRSQDDFALDSTVVKTLEVTRERDGDTYTFTLAPGLTYNEGTPITAADYVFSLLLHSSPAVAELGGVNSIYSHVVGWETYAAGTSATLSGVRLLDAHRFSITVMAEEVPRYYRLAAVRVRPCPIRVIAPEYAVGDGEEGCFLYTADDPTQTPRQLSIALLQETLTSENGYLHQPKVTCGPYQLVAYDAASSLVELKANPAYLGNAEEQKPSIQRVRVIQLLGAEAVAAFERGEVQIVNRLTDGAAIHQARALDGKQASLSSYFRSGYAFLAFACEQAPTSDVHVRRAVAMCVDRNTLCATTLGGYAKPVYGHYGYGQWMTQADAGQLAAFEDIRYNPEQARRELDQSDYRLNSSGNAYAGIADGIRHKEQNGRLVPLELRWAKTPGAVSDALERMLVPVLENLGVRVVVQPVSFAQMLAQYYRHDRGTRTSNLFFLGTNFREPFDPFYTYHTDKAWQGAFNTSGLRDSALMEAALAMRQAEAGDRQSYLERWLAFQTEWHNQLPTAPIYSNYYWDVCALSIRGYDVAAHGGFGEALLYATCADKELVKRSN